MKRVIGVLLVFLLLLGGCAAPTEEDLVPNDAPVIEVQPDEETSVETPDELPDKLPSEEPDDTDEEPKPAEKPTDSVAQTAPSDQGDAEEQEVTLRAMSFNVLAYDPDPAKFKSAERRAAASMEFLKASDYDIIGLQEAVDARGFNWVPAKDVFDFDTYFREELGGIYAFSGVNEAECYGEGLIILYRKSRFELRDSGAYEYTTQTNSFYHWVKLYDKLAKRELYVVNTHLSPNKNGDFEWGNSMRLPQSMQLAAFFDKTVGDSPLIATGDYNCKVDDDSQAAPHRNLQRSGKYMSATTEAMCADGSSGYDHVYFNVEQMFCDVYDMLPRDYTTAAGDALAMSDHCPVIAEFTYI